MNEKKTGLMKKKEFLNRVLAQSKAERRARRKKLDVSVQDNAQETKTAETLVMVQLQLGELEEWVNKKMGTDGIKLSVTIKHGFDGDYIKIVSNDLMDTSSAGSPIDRAMFKSIKIDFWGGHVELEPRSPQICFTPHMDYELLSGGHNGCEILESVWYDSEKNTWIFNQ